MNQNIVTQPVKKDSLGKTFTRGIVGGIGWSFGILIGWLVIGLVVVNILRYFDIGKQIESYITNMLGRSFQQQQYQLMPEQLPLELEIPTDYYPNNLQDLLKENRYEQ